MRSSQRSQLASRARATAASSEEATTPTNAPSPAPGRLKRGSGIRAALSSNANLKGRQPVILGRRQEINLQLNQLLDAVLLVVCLYVGYAFRQFFGTQIKSLQPMESLSAFIWLVVLIMPFGPLFLDLQGFYQFSLQKTAVRAF